MLINDLRGKRFGRLLVVGVDKERTKRRTYYFCQCDCGNIKSIRSDGLTSGDTKSCGCLQKENILKVVNEQIVTHGKSQTRLYKIYSGMKTRCYNKNRKGYKDYGARGIKVCDEWLNDFNSFYDWAMKNGYRDNLTIDRIDVNGDYEPDNCRWVSKKEQTRNKRDNRLIELNGEVKCLSEWCRIYGINRKTAVNRINNGWDPLEAFTTKVRASS